MTNALANT